MENEVQNNSQLQQGEEQQEQNDQKKIQNDENAMKKSSLSKQQSHISQGENRSQGQNKSQSQNRSQINKQDEEEYAQNLVNQEPQNFEEQYNNYEQQQLNDQSQNEEEDPNQGDNPEEFDQLQDAQIHNQQQSLQEQFRQLQVQFMLIQEELSNKSEELEQTQEKAKKLEKMLDTSLLSEKVYQEKIKNLENELDKVGKVKTKEVLRNSSLLNEKPEQKEQVFYNQKNLKEYMANDDAEIDSDPFNFWQTNQQDDHGNSNMENLSALKSLNDDTLWINQLQTNKKQQTPYNYADLDNSTDELPSQSQIRQINYESYRDKQSPNKKLNPIKSYLSPKKQLVSQNRLKLAPVYQGGNWKK